MDGDPRRLRWHTRLICVQSGRTVPCAVCLARASPLHRPCAWGGRQHTMTAASRYGSTTEERPPSVLYRTTLDRAYGTRLERASPPHHFEWMRRKRRRRGSARCEGAAQACACACETNRFVQRREREREGGERRGVQSSDRMTSGGAGGHALATRPRPPARARRAVLSSFPSLLPPHCPLLRHVAAGGRLRLGVPVRLSSRCQALAPTATATKCARIASGAHIFAAGATHWFPSTPGRANL